MMHASSVKSYDMYSEREELLSNVQALKHRINLTERTLGSLNNSRNRSFTPKTSSFNSSPDRDALTMEQLDSPSPPQGRRSRSRRSSHKTGTDMTDGGEVVTLADGDSGRCSMRAKLNHLKHENIELVQDNKALQTKVDEMEYRLKHSKLRTGDRNVQDKVMWQFQERIASLQTEVQSHEKALLQTEKLYSDSQQELKDTHRKLQQCNSLLALTETRMQDQQDMIKQLRQEKTDLIVNAEDLADAIAQQERTTQTDTVRLEEDLIKTDEERQSLAELNNELQAKIGQLNEHLRLKEDLLQAMQKEQTQQQMNNETMNLRNQELNERINSLDKEVVEARTLQHQNTDLHTQLLKLTGDLLNKEEESANKGRQLQQETKQNKSLSEKIKTKSAEVSALQEQFSMMESGLSQQKQRISALELELQQMDEIRMENIELKCRSEEAERRLAVCQKEMSETSKQLHNLESLANRLQKSSPTTRSISPSRSSTPELKMKISQKDKIIDQLQVTLQEVDSKLKLSQLQSDAKENVQERSGKLAIDGDKAKLQGEVFRLKERLTEQQTRCRVLNDRLKDLESELSDTRRKLKNSQQNNTSLKQQKASIELEMKSLKSDMATFEKAAQRHKSELENLQIVVERVQQKLKSTKQELHSKSAQLDDWEESSRQQNHFLEQQVSLLGEQKDDLKKTLSAAQKEAALAHTTLSELTFDHERKQRTLEELKAEFKDKKTEFSTYKCESEAQIHTLNMRIKQLEGSVKAGAEEIQFSSKHTEDMKSQYERILQSKHNEIKDAAGKLVELQEDLSAANENYEKCRKELDLYKKNEGMNNEKISELNALQHSLHAQINTMEGELVTDRQAYQRETEQLQEQLQASCLSLEQAYQRGEQLLSNVNDAERDKDSLSVEIKNMQAKLEETNNNEKENAKAVKELEKELDESAETLARKAEEFAELELRLQRMEVELQRQTSINNQFEGEFRQAQGDLRVTMSQLEELQSVLTMTQDEKHRIEARLKDMESALTRSREELMNKTREIEELDEQIRMQERQLLERTHQVSQLDLTISQHRNDTEGQLKRATNQLRTCQTDRDKHIKQIHQLSDDLSHVTSEMESKQVELQAAQSHIRKLQQDIQEKSGHVTELEERLDKLEAKTCELVGGVGTQQEELKSKNDIIARYDAQVKILQVEVNAIQQDRQALTEYKTRARREITQHLDSICCLEQKLVAAEEAMVSEKTSNNLEDARHKLECLQRQHKCEITRLEEAQNDMLESKQELENEYHIQMAGLEKKDRQLQQQLEQAHEKIDSLKAELQTRLELLRTANEVVVIKEAEVARLQAKVSCIERGQQREISVRSSSLHSSVTPRSPPTMPSPISSPYHTDSPSKSRRNSRIFHPIRDQSPQRLSAVRSLFSPGRPKTSPVPRPSASFIDGLDLASDFNESDPVDDSFYLLHGKDKRHEYILREREELFARLDLLNSQDIPSAADKITEDFHKLAGKLSAPGETLSEIGAAHTAT